MRESNSKSDPKTPSAALTRRSLVAAAGILATVSPVAIGKALANYRGPSRHHGGGARCFLAGTRIMTPAGEVPIESLAHGDQVITRDGTAKAIRWVAKSVFERDGEAWSHDVQPIRIQKNALGEGFPRRDLYMSRTHMLFLDGLLIPAGDLVNGTTITAVSPDTARLEYFHVELEQHDVLLAEGAACETLLVTPEHGRDEFSNADEYASMYGETVTAMVPCAPIAEHGGRRGALGSRLRSALAPVIDIRRRADVVRDGLDARALLSKAA